jgi:hypothetical protein
MGITLTGEERGGSQLCGFRTPVCIRCVPIRPLALFAPVVATLHDGSVHHAGMPRQERGTYLFSSKPV